MLALAAAESALGPLSEWWRGFEYVPAPIGFELRTHIDSQSMTANLYHKDFKPMHERDLPLLKQLHGNTLLLQVPLYRKLSDQTGEFLKRAAKNHGLRSVASFPLLKMTRALAKHAPKVVADDQAADVLRFAEKAKNLSGVVLGENLFLALGARPSPWELSGEQRVERLGDALAETRLRRLHAELIHEIARRWNNASEVSSTGALALTVRAGDLLDPEVWPLYRKSLNLLPSPQRLLVRVNWRVTLDDEEDEQGRHALDDHTHNLHKRLWWLKKKLPDLSVVFVLSAPAFVQDDSDAALHQNETLMNALDAFDELAIAPPDIAGANESCTAEARPLIGGVIVDSWADTWSREDDAQNHNLCRPTTPLAHAACHVQHLGMFAQYNNFWGKHCLAARPAVDALRNHRLWGDASAASASLVGNASLCAVDANVFAFKDWRKMVNHTLHLELREAWDMTLKKKERTGEEGRRTKRKDWRGWFFFTTFKVHVFGLLFFLFPAAWAYAGQLLLLGAFAASLTSSSSSPTVTLAP